MGKAGTIGAISGAISFGIGSLATSSFGVVMSVGKVAFEAGMHAISGGIMSAVEGGNFASGFASGAISSLISSGVGGIGIKSKDLRYIVTLSSGGLSGGISSSIAGGNFWAGVRQGVITAGLNHLAHAVAYYASANGFDGENKTLADYKDKINERIDERIKEIDGDIAENDVEIKETTRKGKIERLTNNNQNLRNQKITLNNAKGFLNSILEKKEYTISMEYGPTSKYKGTVKWGSNDKSLILVHDNSIDTIIHEMIHVNHVVTGWCEISPFKEGARIGSSVFSEVRAWKVTFSLNNSAAEGAYSLDDITVDWVKKQGY